MAEPTYNQSTISDTLAKIEQQFSALQAEREANTVKSRTAGLDAATEESYKQRQLQGQQAQNQFAQNTMANQMSALDAIRTSNASQIASGANAGLAAANQLSAILGLQESNSEAATNIANDAITAATERNTAMAQNAVTAQGQVDQQNQSIRETEANLQLAKAELAKAASQEEAARESASAERYKADKQTTSEAKSNRIREQELGYDKEKTESEQLTSSFKDLTSGWVTTGNAATAVAWTDSDGKTYGDVGSNHGATNRENQNKLRATEARLAAAITSAPTDAARQKAVNDYNRFFKSIQTDGGESCITGDTLITLADGSQKRADMVTPDDLVLTFNQRTQQTEAAKISLLFKEGPLSLQRIALFFQDGTILKILHQHHLFCVEKKNWVLITPKNASKFIGKTFKNINNKAIKLLNVQVVRVQAVRYDVLAYKHIVIFAENMLVGGDEVGWILKGRTKSYSDKDLVDYAYVKKYFPDVTPEIFEAFDGEMMKVWARGFAKFTLPQKLTKILAEYESRLLI